MVKFCIFETKNKNMNKTALLLSIALVSMVSFSSCGSQDEKQVPKTEQEIMNELNKSMDSASNEMSIDTTSKDSVVLK
jgi:hypothetical protein